MTSLFTSLYLLSFKQAEIFHDADIDFIKTSNKNTCLQGIYQDAKNDFFRSRCSNQKQQWGWRKNVKAVEKLFGSYKCIFFNWEASQSLLIFFSNGSIVSIELNSENNTLKNIEIDNSLCGKLFPSRVVDAIICRNYIFITYCESKLTFININHVDSSLSAKLLGKRKGKLVGFEPKVAHVDLIGPSSKNLERKLSINSCNDHLLIWWRFSENDVWPWTPVSHGSDRMNMLVYELTDSPEIVCTIKVTGELIDAKYSSLNSNEILSIIEMKNEKIINIYVSVYEIIRNQCHQSFISQLPLQGKTLAFNWSSNDKLLISDSNNSLLIFDLKKKTSIVTNLLFTPKHVIWHPQDCIALVVGITSQIQCFDAALTCIKLTMFYNSDSNYEVLELNSKFAQSCIVQHILWQKSNTNSLCLILDSDAAFVILKFVSGSVTRNCLSALEIVTQYLKCNSIDEAILLLRSLDWCHESDVHFQCLSKIVNFLLRKPLNLQTQSGLELALGTFYSNIDNLPKRVLKGYQDKINHIARRFFHHLLRFQQFRKAFLLAVDLESQDLFLDLSHVAKQKGENVLAFVALHKANELNCLQRSQSNSSITSSSLSGSSVYSDHYERNGHEADSPEQHENVNFQYPFSQQYLKISEKPVISNNWLHSIETHNNSQLADAKENFGNSTQYNDDVENVTKLGLSYSANKYNPQSSERLRFISAQHSRPLPQLPSYRKTVGTSVDINKSTDSVPCKSNPISSEKLKMKDTAFCINNNIADESDEIEDARINLVHFGII